MTITDLLLPTYRQMLRALASWLRKAREQVEDADAGTREVMRRVPGVLGALNPLVQWTSHWLTPSYRRAIDTGAELHRALNG